MGIGNCIQALQGSPSAQGHGHEKAIAVALEKPADPVIAFTGDGGLMMCLGELATAARAVGIELGGD